MMALDAGFGFKLTSEHDNVIVVRRALRALLGRAEISAERVSDIVLATTEVCTNAVLHAYPEREGVFQIEARLTPECVTVIVRDHGGNYAADRRRGLGVSLVAALADAIEIDAIEGIGTEVRMTFSLLDSE